MNMSQTIGKLAEALAKAQGAMSGAKKEAENTYFGSDYADLAAVVAAIKKPLADNGLAYTQTVDSGEGDRVIVETTLMHASGEWISSKVVMKPVKSDPQGVGSAITYARRYGLQAIAGVPSEDDDGNAASGNPAPSKNTRPAPQKQSAPAAASAPATAPAPKASKEQVALMQKLVTEAAVPDEIVDAWWRKAGVESWEDFTAEQAEKAIGYCRQCMAKKAEPAAA